MNRKLELQMQKAGFRVEGTGGGCTAWMMNADAAPTADGNKGYIMVTVPGDPSHEIEPDQPVCMGLYNGDGEVIAFADNAKLELPPLGIFDQVLDAMQAAEEIGGVENDDAYYALMNEIIAECQKRKLACATKNGSEGPY